MFKLLLTATCTYSSNLFKVVEVAAHEEGGRSHEEVQHASGQDRDIRMLPRQRLGEDRGERNKGSEEFRRNSSMRNFILPNRNSIPKYSFQGNGRESIDSFQLHLCSQSMQDNSS